MISGTPSTDFLSHFPDMPLIVGIDEAGRGPLCGPVVASAVILCKLNIPGLNDSKKLTEKKRNGLEIDIRKTCAFGIGVVEPEEIDRINIFQATMLAMTKAMAELCKVVGHSGEPIEALIDGNMTPEGRCDDWRWPARAIVGGDGIEPVIGAASIIAKTCRDQIMRDAAQKYPQYGWERNKGYGTREHLAALREHGATPLHRRSFAPVAQLELGV